MDILSVNHRGLRRLIEDDDPRQLSPDLVGRIRRILTLLILSDLNGFIADAPSGWRMHRLSGNRNMDWSVSVSGHWRPTFQEVEGRLDRLNLEDYH